jgi:hypothetical protein
MFLLHDDRVWIGDSSSLIFLFLWDFPNVRVYLIFLSFPGSKPWFFFFHQLNDSFFLVPNLAGLHWGFFLQQIKNVCNVLMLDDMHASLPDLKYRSPPLRCSIITGCLCLLFKAFFILSMHWLIRVLAFHLDVSAVPIMGRPWWLLLLLLLKLDHASMCDVAHFIHLLDSLQNCPLIGCACQRPLKLSINHELASSWNSTLQVHVIISLLGNHPVVQTCIS